MRLQLTWTDPNTQQVRSPTLEPPIAFGREFSDMPSALKGKAIRRMVLASDQVVPFHAILAEHKGHLVISDRQGGTETFVNGATGSIQRVKDGDMITIGPFKIKVALLTAPSIEPPAQVAPLATPSAPPQADPFAAPQTDPFASSPTDPFVSPPATATNASNIAGMAMGFSSGGEFSANPVRSGSRDDASSFGADGRCSRKVGFLFKRKCDRTTTEGCKDCRNGQLDPGRSRYEDDYAYYPDYGRYGRGRWGHSYYHDRHHYYYDPHNRRADFNESDAASFENEGDQDYEMDLDAS